ncbi:MAG TPA: lysine 5,6-aminomutase subunit alpha, partial [Nocardioides sp.]|nr:lysine 5,6-aminomutase subunit alpha [Nocardioides sp.]
HGLLDAIADGTFGLMKRPADAGRGLDGVAKKSSAYYNPASELLEEPFETVASRPPQGPKRTRRGRS